MQCSVTISGITLRPGEPEPNYGRCVALNTREGGQGVKNVVVYEDQRGIASAIVFATPELAAGEHAGYTNVGHLPALDAAFDAVKEVPLSPAAINLVYEQLVSKKVKWPDGFRELVERVLS